MCWAGAAAQTAVFSLTSKHVTLAVSRTAYVQGAADKDSYVAGLLAKNKPFDLLIAPEALCRPRTNLFYTFNINFVRSVYCTRGELHTTRFVSDRPNRSGDLFK